MKKRHLVIKKTLSVFLSVVMMAVVFAGLPFTIDANAAEPGLYDVKIRVWDDGDGCNGAGTLVLKLTHKAVNGTGASSTSEHQLSTAERDLLVDGGSGDEGGNNQVNYIFSNVGFPVQHDGTYDIGISYKPDWYFKMYVSAAGANNWTEVIGKTCIISNGSVTTTKKGTTTTAVPSSKMPYAYTTSITPNVSFASVPFTADGKTDVTFTAGSVKDQYGVQWYQDAAISLTTSHAGITLEGNVMHVTNSANDANNYYMTAKAQCSAAVATVSVLVYTFDYKVSFYNSNNVRIGDIQTVNYGGSAVPPADPVLEPDGISHYIFSGWTGDNYQNITSGVIDKSVVAEFTAQAHTFSFKNYVTQPTCTVNGSYIGVCSCGTEKQITELAQGHTLVYKALVSASCSAAGTKAHYACTVCGAKFTDANGSNPYAENDLIIPVLSHTWVTDSTDAAGCETYGTEHQTCSRCGETRDLTIDPLGHSYNVYYTVDRVATCLAPGIRSKHCSRCEATTDAKEIAQLSHTKVRYALGDAAATCTQDGVEAYECSVCHTRLDTVLENLGGHIWSDVITVDVIATCAADGSQSRHCTRAGCDGKTDVTVISKTDHVMGEWTQITPATCAVDGISERVCENCDYYERLPITAAHQMVTVEALEPTCTVNGNTYGKYCKNCDYVEVQSTVILAAGHNYVSEITAPVTCTQDGEKTYTCTSCNDKYTEDITASGHDVVVDPAVNVTCTTDGLTEGSHCSVCKEVIVTQVTITAPGHNYVQVSCTEPSVCTTCGETSSTAVGAHDFQRDEARDAAVSCTENGVEAYTCSKCGTKDDKVILSVGHIWVIDEAVAATCQTTGLTEGSHCSVCQEISVSQTVTEKLAHTEQTIPAVAAGCLTTGLTEGKKCSDCNAVLVEQSVVAALDHSYNDGVTTTPATCTDKGVLTYTCTRCDNYYTQDIDALGHTEAIIPAIAATCTAAGATQGVECSVCQEIIVAPQTEAATGHSHNSEVTVAPDCTNKGIRTFTCTKCDDTYTQEIAANGHTEVQIPAIAATCTSSGFTAGVKCSVCETVLTAPQTENAKGHNYQSSITTAPTCTQNGVRTYNCSRCDANYTETVNLTGHNTVTDAAVAATCTATGLTAGSHCSKCNEVFVAQTVVARLAHTPGSAATCTTSQTCTVCKTVISAAKGHTPVVDNGVQATCVSTGLTDGTHCSVCGTVIKQRTQTPVTDHADNNGDGLCDVCMFDIAAHRQDNCSHMCHQSGFMGFIWKIANFFNKIFKTNQYCSCGAAHY